MNELLPEPNGWAGVLDRSQQLPRVYVGIPHRIRRLLPTLEPLIQSLYEGADVFCPFYYPGQWECTGPDNIRRSLWYLAVIPDDGIIGRGLLEEMRLAVAQHREISLLFQNKPFNVCAVPFEVIGQDWTYYARLQDSSRSSMQEAQI